MNPTSTWMQNISLLKKYKMQTIKISKNAMYSVLIVVHN